MANNKLYHIQPLDAPVHHFAEEICDLEASMDHVIPSREPTYPHLGKRKIIFKSAGWEKDMLVPWRVDLKNFEPAQDWKFYVVFAQFL